MKMHFFGGLKILGSVIITTLVIWFLITVMYGAGSTPVEASPLYNTPDQELHAVLVIIPIISFVLALVFNILTWVVPNSPYVQAVKGIKGRLHRNLND
jgi:hypothetical protein